MPNVRNLEENELPVKGMYNMHNVLAKCKKKGERAKLSNQALQYVVAEG